MSQGKIQIVTTNNQHTLVAKNTCITTCSENCSTEAYLLFYIENVPLATPDSGLANTDPTSHQTTPPLSTSKTRNKASGAVRGIILRQHISAGIFC